MEFIALVAAGIAVFLIALIYPNIGLGGGFLHVPVLMYVLALDKNVAVPISLLLVLMGALAALPRHYRAGTVDLGLAARLSVGAVLGAVAGAMFNLSINKETFEWLFAVTIIIVCGRMLYDIRRGERCDINDDSGMCRSRMASAIGLSVLAGLLGSTFGIGGGLVYVPTLLYVLCRETRTAVGTSTMIIVPTASVGLLTYFLDGSANFGPDAMNYAIVFIPLALVGAYAGSKFCIERLSGRNIRMLFVSLAMVVAVGMIASLVA